ncbi:MAG: hypothetical protein MUF65_01820 [Rubritepida sp.]|jgi:hypothetical protein|nr:hypothetical protein [Rubritepida sp.]MCU0944089.1 hypothetical protein [Rubritepida sp.]
MLVPLAVLALIGCQAPPPPTAPIAMPTAPSVQPAGSLDGVYLGQWTTTLDLTGQCATPVLNSTQVTVSGGAVTILNPQTGMSARGTVRADGRFSATGTMRGQLVTFSGLIAQGSMALTGATNPAGCNYEARLARQA